MEGLDRQIKESGPDMTEKRVLSRDISGRFVHLTTSDQDLFFFFSFFFLMKKPQKLGTEGGCFYLFIYLFLAVLGLRFCARAFSSCGEWGPLFIAVRGPLTVTASPIAEHRLQTRRLSSCGSRA